MSFNEGRTVYIVKETTPGTDPGVDPDPMNNLGAMQAVPVEDSEPSYSPQLRERPQVGAVGPGRSDSVLREDWGYSGRIPIFPISIQSETSRAIQHLIEQACGLGDPVYAAGPPKTLTWLRTKYAAQTYLTVYELLAKDGGGDAILTRLHGLQGSGNYVWGPETDLALEFELQAMAGSQKDAGSLPAATYQDTNSAVREAYTGLSARIETLQELGGDLLYEGLMTSGSINMGLSGARLNGLPVGVGGVASRIRSRPGRASFECAIEMAALSSWDPRSYAGNATPIKVIARFVANDDPNDIRDFEFYTQLGAATRGFEEGFAVLNLSGHLLWLPSAPGEAPGKVEGSVLRVTDKTTPPA